jgi:hypothetical protein
MQGPPLSLRDISPASGGEEAQGSAPPLAGEKKRETPLPATPGEGVHSADCGPPLLVSPADVPTAKGWQPPRFLLGRFLRRGSPAVESGLANRQLHASQRLAGFSKGIDACCVHSVHGALLRPSQGLATPHFDTMQPLLDRRGSTQAESFSPPLRGASSALDASPAASS